MRFGGALSRGLSSSMFVGAVVVGALVACAPAAPDRAPSSALSAAPLPSASAPALVTSALATSATPPANGDVSLPRETSLSVLPSEFDFSRNPGVVPRIASSPHRYYRFINPRFESVVCHRYADWLAKEPKVALHGDAHVEQYGATDVGRGLTDLDDTAIGPRIIDLLRMGTSIFVAVHEKAGADASFAGLEPKMIDALLRGYAEGLAHPDVEPPPSPLDQRLEKKFKKDSTAFLADADKSMLPFASPAEETEAKRLHGVYETLMLQMHMYGPKNKSFPAGSFTLKKMGPIASGIGSALDRRVLMHLEGRTNKPGDDLLVELKPLRNPPDPRCLTALRDYRPARFLMGKARVRHFDPVVLPDDPLWAGEWFVNHEIVKIDKTIESPADLEAVVFESGFVLARAHLGSHVDGTAFGVPSASDKPLITVEERRALARKALTIDEATRDRLVAESKTLAAEVDEGWARFRDASATK